MNKCYPYTIYSDWGRLPKRGKIQAWKMYNLSKILEEFSAGEEEYPGKLLSAYRNTNKKDSVRIPGWEMENPGKFQAL
jgi:hypothetical protein